MVAAPDMYQWLGQLKRGLEQGLGQVDQRLATIEQHIAQHVKATQATQAGQAALHKHLGSVDQQIERVTQAQEQAQQSIDEFRTGFAEFVEQNQRDRDHVIAHIRLTQIRLELDRRFQHYAAVRHSVRATLRALEADLIQEITTQVVAEQLRGNTPGYWLAAAQVGLVAWIRDDEGTAEHALLDALACDPDRTALFFALFNARYCRAESTDQWLRAYLSRHDGGALGGEFLVVLDAALVGALGAAAQRQVSDTCQDWVAELSLPDIDEQQVAWWRNLIVERWATTEGQPASLRQRFPTLATVSPQWPEVLDWYRRTTVFVSTRDRLGERLRDQAASTERRLDQIDRILMNLATVEDAREARLRHEERALQAIIDHRVDVDNATTVRLGDQPLERTPVERAEAPLFEWINNVVCDPGRMRVSRSTAHFGVRLASRWIIEAVRRHTEALAKARPSTIRVTLDTWSGELGERTDPGILTADLTAEVERRTTSQEARTRMGLGRYAAAAFSLAAVIYVLVNAAAGTHPSPWLITVLLVTSMLSAIWGLWTHRRIPERVRQIRENGNRQRDMAVAQLRRACDEFQRLGADWDDRQREAQDLIDFVENIPDLPLPAEPPTGPAGARWQTPGWRLGPPRQTPVSE